MRQCTLLSLPRLGLFALLTCGSSACESSDSPKQANENPIQEPDDDSETDEQEAPDAGAGPEPTPEPEEPERVERLLIADGVDSMVHVVDVGGQGTLASFATDALARVYPGPSGRYGYAVQGAGDIVQIIDSGLFAEDHGDHVDLIKTDPRLHAFALQGQLPVHFVPHGAHVAAFFDDDGIAHVLHEGSLADREPQVIHIDTGLPHHGVALSFAERVLVTTPALAPDATRASPVGLAVFDAQGAATGESFGPCAGVHGEAALDDVAVFGCSDGVLAIFEEGGALRAQHVANPPSDLMPPPRVGTVLAHPEAAFFVGNYGAQALSKIDLSQGSITPVSVPAPYLQFAFSDDGKHILLLTKDGRLHRLDASTLADEESIAVTTPPSDDTGQGAKYPQFAVGAERVYVTDPDEAKVVIVDFAKFKVEGSVAVEGAPTKVALLHAGDAHGH